MNDSQTTVALLIASAKAGDAAALDQLIRHYRPFLRIIAEQQIGEALGRRQDGSDVAQQTCLEAATAFARFRGTTEQEFTAWFRQIMNHNIENLIRDNRAKKRDLRREKPLYNQQGSAELPWHEPNAEDTSPSQNVLRGEEAFQLAAALEDLPDDQRLAVTRRYLEGKRVAEIAEEFGRTDSAIAGLIHRGVAALRSKLNLP